MSDVAAFLAFVLHDADPQVLSLRVNEDLESGSHETCPSRSIEFITTPADAELLAQRHDLTEKLDHTSTLRAGTRMWSGPIGRGRTAIHCAVWANPAVVGVP